MVLGGGANVVGAMLVVDVVDDVVVVAVFVVAPVADALGTAVAFVLAGVLSSLHAATSNATDIAATHNRQRRRGTARRGISRRRIFGDRSSRPRGVGRDAIAATAHDCNVPQQSLARTCSGDFRVALDR